MGKMTDDQPVAPVADETPATTGGVTDAAINEGNTTEAAFKKEVAADAGLTALGDITDVTTETPTEATADAEAAI